MTLYNDNDPFCCAWLRELIAAGHLPAGDVLPTSIETLTHANLTPYNTFHAFAGIGGWPLALALAGWPASRSVWTGSCPCQPFSCAGKGKGAADKRHLWPAFHKLIALHRPTTIFGEQVASPAGRKWFAGVRTDLEALGYAVGAADLCAASVSAPMVSQRVHWVAAQGVATTDSAGCTRSGQTQPARRHGDPFAARASSLLGLATPNDYHEHWWSGPLQVGWNCLQGKVTRGSRQYNAQWRIKPGLSLLAYGIPGRVGQLCGFGNAIVPQVAAAFITAFLDAERDLLGEHLANP